MFITLGLISRPSAKMLSLAQHADYAQHLSVYAVSCTVSLNGSFTQALLDLARRGQRAFFKLKNIFNNIPCSAPNFMHTNVHVYLTTQLNLYSYMLLKLLVCLTIIKMLALIVTMIHILLVICTAGIL